MAETRDYVLIVEDEPDIAEYLADEFNDKGYLVIQSEEFSDAALKADTQKFKLVLSDLRLKTGTGAQLVKHIKTNNRHINYDTPIVMISSWLTSEVIHDLESQIDHAFVKPICFEDVTNKCIEIMNSL